MKKEFFKFFTVISLVFLSILIIAPFFGASKLSFREVLFNKDSIDRIIFISQRLPRVILGAFCGAGLGIAGSALQVILKNPLAEPYILGVSGISSLFLTITIVFPVVFIPSGVAVFAGAVLAIAVIDLVFVYFKGNPSLTILAGVCLNIFSSSLILFMKYFASPDKLVQIERWFMGGLDISGFDGVLSVCIVISIAIFVIISFSNELYLVGFDLSLAKSRGVNIRKVKRSVYLASGVITSAVVWIAGPIGFVGLIIPHAVRPFSGENMLFLSTGTVFLGGAFLVLCDLFARIIIAPAELPVGIITAILGSPVFFWILFRFRKK